MTGADVMLLALLAQSATGASVEVHGHAAIVADALPRRDAVEARPEVGIDLTARPADAVTIHFDGIVDGLLARRGGRVSAASGLVRDAWGEVRVSALDLRAGSGRLAWGRLDEIAPTDVINPLDAARFLIDGRAEARLPVAFVRARVSPSDRLRLEGVLVPRFRRGLFDRLDEDTSPFNLVRDAAAAAGPAAALVRRQIEPEWGWTSVSGGGRLDVTLGRTDAALAVYRGFDGPGAIGAEPVVDPATASVSLRAVEFHPRFTMIGGDMETVAGPWALRSEVAVFVERSLLAPAMPVASAAPVTPAAPESLIVLDAPTAPTALPRLVPGRSIDAGAGFDRRFAAWHVVGSAVLHREWALSGPDLPRTDLDLVASLQRSFRAERHAVRGFVVVNPADAAAFARVLWTWKVRDDVALEASGGTFLGTGDDTIGRFSGRDFLLARARYDF